MAKRYGDWIHKDNLSGGAQGSTYLVTKEGDETGKIFVLKKISNTEKIHRLEREVEAGLELDHPNILKIVDYQIEGKEPYLVSEYCSGDTLKKLDLKSLSILQKLKIFLQICEAVGFAHAKKWTIVHRDLKPENIFLKEDGLTPVVGDFGICFIDDDGDRFTLVDEAIGARRYAAPELEYGKIEKIKPSADVYSLGKILYWMLAGRIFDREKQNDESWDLRKVYKEPAYNFIYNLFDNTIILNPEERLQDANAVTLMVEEIIKKVETNARSLDFKAEHQCLFCGTGFYEKYIEFDYVDGKRQMAWENAANIIGFDWNKWNTTKIFLICHNCGNEQTFRPLHFGSGKSMWKNYPPTQIN